MSYIRPTQWSASSCPAVRCCPPSAPPTHPPTARCFHPCTQALQSQLETVVPRSEGGAVLVVDGKLRGQRARLLQRNTESQMAAVQLVADMTVHRLPLDCVAQFVGSMDEEDG